MQVINNSDFWFPSCESEYYHKDNKFIFKTKHGIPGKCPNDDKPIYRNGELWCTHKERCETKSPNLLVGNYIWSADIEIDWKQIPDSPSFLQIHWEPESSIDNFIKLGVNKYGYFDINGSPKFDCDFITSFNLKTKIECQESYTNVDFFSNNQYIGSYRKLTTELPFIKFGVYNINSSSDITQTYNNVKVEYNNGA